MYGIYTVNFECVWMCVCVDMRTNAWISWPSCKSLNLSKWASRRHKFVWSWWPPTCSHALMHACSNAAKIDCTALSPRAWRSHSAICIGIILGYFQGEIPGCPLYLLGVCYNIQFKDRAGHESLTKIMIFRCKVCPTKRWTLRAVAPCCRLVVFWPYNML